MTLDEFKKQQKAAVSDFEYLAKSDKKKARDVAMSRLRAANIVDSRGKLTKQYR